MYTFGIGIGMEKVEVCFFCPCLFLFFCLLSLLYSGDFFGEISGGLYIDAYIAIFLSVDREFFLFFYLLYIIITFFQAERVFLHYVYRCQYHRFFVVMKYFFCSVYNNNLYACVIKPNHLRSEYLRVPLLI